jgi:ferredoxin
LTRLRDRLEVIAPVSIEGETCFVSWKGQPLALARNPLIPPTEFLLPHREVLFKYIQESGSYTFDKAPAKPRLIFGIRPCDLRATFVLDRIFKANPPDHQYLERRKSTFLAALNCLQPTEECFCSSLGFGPDASEGYDLLFTELKEGFLVESVSPAGILILMDNSDLFLDANDEHEVEKRELMKASRDAVRLDRTQKRIEEAIKRADWEALGRHCMSCGGCTFVCPVCHCFNILDLGVPDGERLRCRDTCILSGFSRMAGGNPRRTQGERLQNWYMDKFFYIPENTGLLGCVGCGRCSKVCFCGMDRWTLEE